MSGRSSAILSKKNLAASKAGNDWILSLDCDERLTAEVRQSILAIKDSIKQAEVYSMNRKTSYIYRWLNYCWYPDTKIRLFNRKTAHWGGTNPHDRIVVATDRIKHLRGDIEHYSFDSISDHLATIEKFTEISADELIRRGKRFNISTPITHAVWTLLKLYVFKVGFLDGFAGLPVSMLSSMHVFVKYSKALVKRRTACPD